MLDTAIEIPMPRAESYGDGTAILTGEHGVIQPDVFPGEADRAHPSDRLKSLHPLEGV